MTGPSAGAAGDSGADANTRCGFVALIGAPNVGKSTLVNQMVGSKISIVTPKPQTTRCRVIAIALAGSSQIVFVDTPGIFEPRRRLDRSMVHAAWVGAHDADIIAVLIDAARGIDDDARRILDHLRQDGRKAIGVINKIDAVKRPSLLGLAEALGRESLFSELFMISALTGDGVEDLRRYLADHVPPGPWLYPADQIAEMPQRLLAAEITREQVFLQLSQELPYAATVVTESWQERADGSVRIEQTIVVRRPSQRMIVLGKSGRRIKAIGSAARAELTQAFGRTVHLFLHVKVRENWLEQREHYNIWGLQFDV